MACSLQELSERFSAIELEHWRKFDILEPIGDSRHDLLNAMLCRTVFTAGVKEWPGDNAFQIEWGKRLIDLAPETIAEDEQHTKNAFRAMLSKKPVIS